MTDEQQQSEDVSRCGYVAIVGRPNVGKSTLLNHILGQKLAITSRKPQTTRHNMLGIKTEGNVQAVYVDTPGLHKNGETALNRYMNRTAASALKDVDVVIFVVDRTRWTDEDQAVLERVQYVTGPLIVAVNKTDRIEDKAELLPHLRWLAKQMVDKGNPECPISWTRFSPAEVHIIYKVEEYLDWYLMGENQALFDQLLSGGLQCNAVQQEQQTVISKVKNGIFPKGGKKEKATTGDEEQPTAAETSR